MKNICITTLIILFLFITPHFSKAQLASKKILKVESSWSFRQAGKEWLPATVPGNVHTDLLRNKKNPDPFVGTNEKELQWIEQENWEYKTSFRIEKEDVKNEHALLNFKGLDTYAEVFLNDTKILDANNMFREWKVDVIKILKPGDNNLLIKFRSPIKEVLPTYNSLNYKYPSPNDQAEDKVGIFSRKAGFHFGWDWGPRFVTAGIWRPVFIEFWNKARIVDIDLSKMDITKEKAMIHAEIETEASVAGTFKIEITGDESNVNPVSTDIQIKKGLNKTIVTFTIANPELWWPNGLGKQKLYKIRTRLSQNNKLLDEKNEKTGIRTIEVIHENDNEGKNFYVKVNGHPVFMKGANYIPSDNFQDRVTPDKYETLLQSSKDANMNMLRVWGGGIYEEDLFYEKCDEKGLLVWQDFMFACALYPGDEKFLKNVEQEAIDNIKRLRNHPSLALWCGNNEIETAWQHWGWQKQFGWSEEVKVKLWDDYKKLFHTLLPSVVKKHDPTRFYHRSSPSANNDSIEAETAGFGDKHYWGVWHAEEPYTAYKKNISRFMSEYGFQSFPELRTVEYYATEKDRDIESTVMLHHQRHPRGNPLIREYMFRDYNEPKDFASFLYVGQVLQAEIIKFAAEAHRRVMPYNMGSLYWQLNDCWPVASWSGIDYFNRWKALHYFARDFFNPILVSFNEEVDELQLYIVSDQLKPVKGKVMLQLRDFNGKNLWTSGIDTTVAPNSSKIYFKMDRKKLLQQHKPEEVFLSAVLTTEGNPVSKSHWYFTQAKNLKLEKTMIVPEITKANGRFGITLSANKLAKNVYLTTKSFEGLFSDNYFDLVPGETKMVYFDVAKNISVDELKKDLQIISLVDTY